MRAILIALAILLSGCTKDILPEQRIEAQSLEELLQVIRDLLNKEDIEYDDLGKTGWVTDKED